MSALEKAKARRADLLAELARVERFIADYGVFEAGETPKAFSKRGPYIKGQNVEVLKRVLAVLTASPKPMRSVDITQKILDDGFNIVAQNPANYVGTIIHRNQDKIERTREGSRLRGAIQ